MKDAGAAMVDLLGGTNKFFIADLLTVTLYDPPAGVPNPIRWTGASIGITLGVNTFSSLGPAVDMGRHRQSSELTTDTRDVTLDCGSGVMLGSKLLTAQAIGAIFRRATVRVERAFMGSPGDTAAGALRMFDGSVADPEVYSTKVVLHCESGPAKLAVVEAPSLLIAPPCQNKLFDTVCGVSKAAFTLSNPTTCQVLSSNAARTAVLTNLPEPIAPDLGGMHFPKWPNDRGYYAHAVMKFNSDAAGNPGISRTVEYSKDVGGTSQLWFSEPWPNAITSGDKFTVILGCDKFAFTCAQRFWGQPEFTKHFRGFRHLPGTDVYAGFKTDVPLS